MTHGSLFSGIGGFDLAAQWMGWENVFHCEINPFGQRHLKFYWPNSISYNDIMDTDFSVHRGRIDILSGGFPCQPYSTAGKRLGKDDERHLWPYMLRAIQQIQPRWIVGENVLGLVNWNGGLVFHEVQTDLEAQGYEVQPYVLPAAAVNAPHRRDRVWFVAYASDNGFHGTKNGQSNRKGNDGDQAREGTVEQFEGCGGAPAKSGEDASNSNLHGRNERNCKHEEQSGERGFDAQRDIEPGVGDGFIKYATGIGQQYAMENGELERRRFGESDKRNFWHSFPSVSSICSGNDGIPNRLDGITFSKWRNESIKAYGNAVVPQVVYQIFKAIEEYENMHK
jgi:DNA (cytosine-5)-methyltransferase 1